MELHALRIIRDEAPGVEIILSSQSSPELALALMRGKMDVAFLRRETQTVGLSFRFLTKEPLIAVSPQIIAWPRAKRFGRTILPAKVISVRRG